MPYRDHIDNILGVDTSNNLYSSTNVAQNKDGSIIERLEYVQTVVDASILPRNVDKDLAAAALTGSAVAIFTVTGPVEISHMGAVVSEAIPAGANTLKFSFDVTGAGAAADLCGATDLASAAINQLFLVDGVKATGLVKTTDPGIGVFANEHMPITLTNGSITYTCSAGPPASGGLQVFVAYRPLAPGAQIVAA